MKKVGKYRLEREIGQGAFGRVYQATNTATGAVVAIKVVPLKNLIGHLRTQLERELLVMKKVKSQSVVELFDVLRTPNSVYIAMEYCPGGDLDAYLKSHRPVSEPTARRWLSNLLDAFSCLQRHKVMHRDLKLANILLSSTDDQTAVAKVADFGFARFASETSCLADTMLGTPLFMAPEILQKQRYSYKIDVWSLGVIAYEILVGKTPFYVYSMEELMQAQRKPLEFPSDCAISEEAKDLIRTMMKYDVRERPDFDAVRTHAFFEEKKKPPQETPVQADAALESSATAPKEKEQIPQPCDPAPKEIEQIPQHCDPVPKEIEQIPQPCDPVPKEIEQIPQPCDPVPKEIEQIPQPCDPVPKENEHISQPSDPIPPPVVPVPSQSEESKVKERQLIDDYEVIEDQTEEEFKQEENLSVIADSQFIPIQRGDRENEDLMVVEAVEEEEIEEKIEEQKTEVVVQETKPVEQLPEETKAQLPSREDTSRGEFLRLDFKCSQELTDMVSIGDFYTSNQSFLIAIAIFLAVQRELERCEAQFAALQQFGTEEGTVGTLGEKIRAMTELAEKRVSGLQLALTEQDLERSVMKFEDTGLRVEGRLLADEATRLHDTLPPLSCEEQISVLRQALSLLSIALSDSSSAASCNALISQYTAELTQLLGTSL